MYDLRPGKRTGCYVLWLMTVAIVLSSMNVVALSPVQACGGLSAVPLVYSMDAQAGILHPYLASRCDTVNPTPSPTTIAGEGDHSGRQREPNSPISTSRAGIPDASYLVASW